MTDRLTYSLEHDEFVAGLQAVVGSIRSTARGRQLSRRLRALSFLHIPAIAAAGVLVALLFPQMWLEALTAGAMFLAVHLAMNWYVAQAELRQMGVTYDARRHQDVTAVFDPEGAHYLGQEHRQSWHWPLLQRFHELPAVYVLEFVGFDMLVVPRRVFSSIDEADAWAANIRNRSPEAPSDAVPNALGEREAPLRTGRSGPRTIPR